MSSDTRRRFLVSLGCPPSAEASGSTGQGDRGAVFPAVRFFLGFALPFPLLLDPSYLAVSGRSWSHKVLSCFTFASARGHVRACGRRDLAGLGSPRRVIS